MIESLLPAVAFAVVCSILLGAYDRWIRPWKTRRWINKALAKIKAVDYVPPAKQSDCGMSIDAEGITINKIQPSHAPLHSIAWSEVVRVTAFKRDYFTVDCICIAIATKDGTTKELNEDMEGWEAFTEALPKYLPGSKQWPEWFSLVAFPAFATNETLLFDRRNSPKATSTEVV